MARGAHQAHNFRTQVHSTLPLQLATDMETVNFPAAKQATHPLLQSGTFTFHTNKKTNSRFVEPDRVFHSVALKSETLDVEIGGVRTPCMLLYDSCSDVSIATKS